MDVSRVNPEDVLVDYSNLELGDGDCSAEIDESLLGALNHGKEDKVMVSIRYVSSLKAMPKIFVNLSPASGPPRCLLHGLIPPTVQRRA